MIPVALLGSQMLSSLPHALWVQGLPESWVLNPPLWSKLKWSLGAKRKKVEVNNITQLSPLLTFWLIHILIKKIFFCFVLEVILPFISKKERNNMDARIFLQGSYFLIHSWFSDSNSENLPGPLFYSSGARLYPAHTPLPHLIRNRPLGSQEISLPWHLWGPKGWNSYLPRNHSSGHFLGIISFVSHGSVQ